MPSYSYLCATCGAFTAHRLMAEFAEPQACPTCGREAPRALLKAPNLNGMNQGRRQVIAAGDRMAEQSYGLSARHPAGCSCCMRGSTSRFADP
jgi:putative FmdB family regulatory protein